MLGKRWRFVLGNQASDGLDQWAAKAARKSGKDDYDNFSLPVGSGFFEDALKLGARRLISDAQFDRSAEVFLPPRDEVLIWPQPASSRSETAAV